MVETIVEAEGAIAPAGGLRETHFAFEHKVFALPGGHFRIDPSSKDPVFDIQLGDLKAMLPFGSLKDAFGIVEGSTDARLLDLVAQGLRFVKRILPGERIPGELLNGTASWVVDDKHRLIARGRLTVQLVSWITGSEMIVVDLAQLEQVVEDPQTKGRLRTAFEQIAERLGIPKEESEREINGRIDTLTQELSYIEALRDRFRSVQAIEESLVGLQRIYRTDRGFCDEVQRMIGLIRKPLRIYDGIFEQADAQTGEIVGALKDFDTTVAFIRKIRDGLRMQLMDWEDLLAEWESTPVERSPAIERLQKATYRFLAGRFIQTKVWERK